jgi:2-C-methyl-D-erythritol 4-phosphate cytidylyltransferase
MANLLIIAAAGEGRRLGRLEPKALVPLLGRPMIAWTLDALSAVPFRHAVVAATPGREADFEEVVRGRARVVAGGATRGDSVRRAFESLDASPEDLICIHDAARPFVTSAETISVVDAAQGTGAATAATPVVDTLKRVDGGRVASTLDRGCLFAAGTPQVFRADLLARALAAGRDTTDEATLVEALGVAVAVVSVSRLGFKVTTPADLEMAEALLRSRNTEHGTRNTG